MRYAIDVLFLDGEGVVLRQQSLRPWRASAWVWKARGVLEFPAGTLAESATAPGDRIELKEGF